MILALLLLQMAVYLMYRFVLSNKKEEEDYDDVVEKELE